MKKLNAIVVRYPGCIMDEVAPAIELLGAQLPLSIVDMSDINSTDLVDIVVVPGGNCENAILHKPLHELIRTTHSRGGIVAGICNGALVLASAGVLSNKKCTHTAHPKYAPIPEFAELLSVAEVLFRDSIYVDEDVVVDGKIITAKPWAANEFAKIIKRQLSN